jgi:sulfite dehydrogenase (quinone) subunit SoeA
MAIRNAWAGDPYPIDTLFLYMSNMAWNSAMNTSGTIAMLTDRREDGEYRIPRFIYVDAYYSETVAYADLVLPDTTYLERYDCISLLDRPISSADGPADAIRQPVVLPDRDVRPFQDVLLDLGARLNLPGMVDDRGKPAYRDFADYMVRHEREPGIGPLAGWRGVAGDKIGVGEPNPDQLNRYIANGCFWRHAWPKEARYYKHVNRAYLDEAKTLGLLDKAEPIVLQIYSEALQRFRLAAQGHGAHQPPEDRRDRILRHFDPLPIWHEPFEIAAADHDAFPLHAITQRPMAMYHSWGSQNAWLRQIHGRNRLFMNRRSATLLDLADDDWVWIESRQGRVKGQLRLMDGVEANTVWTWNAIGKRAGAWNLASDAREATQGFLLNHLIPESLASGGGLANADPVTGQAAWFDLRVRVIKADRVDAGESEPRFAPLTRPPGLAPAPEILRYGASFKDRS